MMDQEGEMDMRNLLRLRRVRHMLLYCVILLGLLPANALAAEQRNPGCRVIDNVNVELELPVVGRPLDFTPICTSGEYEIDYYTTDVGGLGTDWVDTDSGVHLSPGAVAQAGRNYRVEIAVTTTDKRACFKKSSPDGSYGTQASINGDSTLGAIGLQYELDGDAIIYAYFDMARATETVSVSGITAPRPGQSPVYSATEYSDAYDICRTAVKDNFRNGVFWFDLTAQRPVSPTDTFVGGHSYRVWIDLLATDAGMFATSPDGAPAVTAYVNDRFASVVQAASESAERELHVFCDFICEYESISSVGITGLDAPRNGQPPDYSVTLTGTGYALANRNDDCYKNGICWSLAGGGDLPTGGVRFEGGQEYQVTIRLTAAEGYAFALSPGGTLNVTATVNGKTAEVLGDRDEIVVTCRFTGTTTDAILYTAAVNGIDAPVVGAVPDYSAVAGGSGYALRAGDNAREKNGVTWIHSQTGNALTVGGARFEAGVSYTVVVALTAAEGYAFATDQNGIPVPAGTVNGRTATVSVQDKYNVYLRYTFPATSANTIDRIDVSGIRTQAADPTKTDKSELTVSSEHAAIRSLSWKSSANADGVDYSLTLVLEARNGFVFSENIAATVNSSYAGIVSVTATELILRWGFTAANSPAAPVSFDDVQAGSYYFQPVRWAVGGGITNGITATSFGPDVTCSQAHILTFLWRAVGCPKPVIANPYSNAAVTDGKYFYDAFLWAWEKGLVGNTAHDPNAPCSRSDVVSYLWKLEGRPWARPTGFTDVPAGAPWAQAVAWAVETGITNGMTETSFGPDVICTRGHIVTFLWRYMGI